MKLRVYVAINVFELVRPQKTILMYINIFFFSTLWSPFTPASLHGEETLQQT